MEDKERIRVEIEEIQPGNWLHYSYAMGYKEILIMGSVAKIEGNQVRFNNEEVKDVKDCYGCPITDIWLKHYGLTRQTLPPDILFIHQLQNRLEKKFKHGRCIKCELPHGWNEEGVFDLNLPVGKRIWLTLCEVCKANFESQYRTGKINRTQLLLEFSSILEKLTRRLAKTDP